MAREAAAVAALPALDIVPGPDRAADAHLLREVIAGSHTAVAALYDLHAGAVFRAAFRACGDRPMAEDVVQETFLALWDRAEQFDPGRGSLLNWLLAIARNRAIDHLRAAGRRVRAIPFSSVLSDDAEPGATAQWLETAGTLVAAAPPEPVPEAALLDDEDRVSIEAGLATLNEPERRVIVLAYREGLSQTEIAARLGWPLGTVKTRMRRAHHQLRDALERAHAFDRRP